MQKKLQLVETGGFGIVRALIEEILHAEFFEKTIIFRNYAVIVEFHEKVIEIGAVIPHEQTVGAHAPTEEVLCAGTIFFMRVGIIMNRSERNEHHRQVFFCDDVPARGTVRVLFFVVNDGGRRRFIIGERHKADTPFG